MKVLDDAEFRSPYDLYSTQNLDLYPLKPAKLSTTEWVH